MKTKTGMILIGIGILFLLNAIFGRYLVLPGYISSLEQGSAAIEEVRQNVPVWKIVRYIVWGYSFKLGIFLVVLGACANALMQTGRFWLLTIGGLVYLMVAFVPLPSNSLAFGIGGGIMTVLMVLIFLYWAKERRDVTDNAKTGADLRIIGYFFFAMATYNLCPLMGVKAFALYPERMIAYGVQAEASTYASHILSELVLGWLFLFLSHRLSAKTNK